MEKNELVKEVKEYSFSIIANFTYYSGNSHFPLQIVTLIHVCGGYVDIHVKKDGRTL